MSYNYHEVVKSDVLEWIEENVDFREYDDIGELEEYLNDTLFNEDSVTGNVSGSYTFSISEAWENIGDNLDLLEETAEAFGDEPTIKPEWNHGPEWWDVSIRCYVLPQAIREILDECEEEFNRVHEEMAEDEEGAVNE